MIYLRSRRTGVGDGRFSLKDFFINFFIQIIY